MANKAISTLAVGSSVYLNVGGVKKEFLVVHQGLPSSLYDESCNGTWLLMKDIYENRQWYSSSVNKYESSTIHSYLNSTFLNLFDVNIRDAIKQVKLPYRKNGGKGGTDQSGANGLSCKVFLLSGPEVGLSGVGYMPNDGAKLDYFNANTEADPKRIAYLNGSAVNWWLRSPYTGVTSDVWHCKSNGYQGINSANNSYGIRPALILPSTTLVDDSGNVVVPALTAHKTLVNGTAYEVKGGKCMVGGTVYNILKGRTLIAGTGADVAFESGYTYVINNTIDFWSSFNHLGQFVSNGATYAGITKMLPSTPVSPSELYFLYPEGQTKVASISNNNSVYWLNTAYRTITFDEPPTGDLLTWLQANAVQQ